MKSILSSEFVSAVVDFIMKLLGNVGCLKYVIANDLESQKVDAAASASGIPLPLALSWKYLLSSIYSCS